MPMLPMFFLISFGGLVGWITAILQVPRDSASRLTAYGNGILAGAVGGGTSGLLFLLLTNTSIRDYNAQINALIFGVLGAIVFAIMVLSFKKHSQ